MTSRLFPSFALILLLWLTPLLSLQADASLFGLPSNAQSDELKAEAPLQASLDLSTPLQTVQLFQEAMQQLKDKNNDAAALQTAIATLDLSNISIVVKKDRGELVAWQIYTLMQLSKEKLKLPPKSIKKDLDTWVLYDNTNYQLRLLKQIHKAKGDAAAEQDEQVRWLFDTSNNEALVAILAVLQKQAPEQTLIINQPFSLKLLDSIPSQLKSTFLGLQSWQWIGIFLFVLIGVLVDFLFKLLSIQGMRRFIKRTEQINYQHLPDDMLRPFGLMFMALVWWIGLKVLILPEWASVVLVLAVKFLISVSGVWAAYRLVDLISAWFKHKASLTSNKLDDALVPLVQRTLKIFVTIIGLIFVADSLQINVTGLLAGLGLGGLAFALAAKDLAQNLFGTVTILVERTFSVGDWVKIDDVEGTVEDISFRSTRIRTFYDSIITLPNSNMITTPVDNYGERRYRRYTSKLGLAYSTPPDKIEAFCEGVREIVRLHPYMRKDSYQVYFNGYADSALEILIYIFWKAPDWATELRERHRFLLDVLRLAHDLGVEFAYPTQTVFWKEIDPEAQAVPEQMQQEEAFQAARNTARNIVNKGIKYGEIPPPVSIAQSPLSK